MILPAPAWKAIIIMWLLSGVVILFTLWSIGRLGWPVIGILMASSAISALMVAFALALCRCERTPQNLGEALLVAAMHATGIATAALLGGEANPQISLHPEFRFALIWLWPSVLVTTFLLEALGLSLYVYAGSQRTAR